MGNSYLADETDITRQEGDTGSIVFTISSDLLDLTVYSTVKFQVRREEDVERTMALVIDKSTGSGITISSQTVTVSLDASDTSEKSGSGYRWEIQFSGNSEIITAGKGKFIIEPELIL